MKKIFNIIFTAAALLAFAPTVIAQGDYSIQKQILDPDTELEMAQRLLRFPNDNGLQLNGDFAYSKNVSAPFSDGTYWIKLESYATGSASRIEGSAPADIVLVLDLSSSMTGSRTVIDGYTPQTTPDGGWKYSDITTDHYIMYEGEYYQLAKGGNNNNNRYVRFEDDNNTRYYLMPNGIVQSNNRPSGTIANNTVLYNGTLYRVASHTETRIAALKRATKAFIDQIELNDKYEDEDGTIERENGRLGNRISIITFNSSATVQITLANGQLSDAVGGGKSTAETMKDLVDGFQTASGTTPYNGFVAANAQLATISDARKEAASRTVVFFTDGEPYDQDNGYGTGYRYKAVGEALKTKTKDNPDTETVEGYDATVFSVGLFSSSPSHGGDTWRFLNYISSNAPNSPNYNTPGEGWDENAGFYYDASDGSVDLSDVFTEIAKQSGGTTSSLSAASSNVDIVSNSFILPDDVDASTVEEYVKVFIAKVDDAQTKANNGNLKFYEEIMIGHIPNTSDYYYQPLNDKGEIIPDTDPKKVDQGVTVSLVGDNGIKVTGFDYSSCFCGPIYEEGYTPTGTDADKSRVDHYQGFKIIIMIPIKMNPDAVGGPNVDTNAPGSGIYAKEGDQTAYVEYKSPDVSLPYNLYIEKEGLNPGESAKFTIQRAYIPDKENWTPEEDIPENAWQYVSSIFVTQPMNAAADNKPVVKVRGLPSTSDAGDYVYRIVEEIWAWSYHRAEPQYTVKSKIDNPFTFENDPKDDIDVKVRHAESKAENVFNNVTKKVVYTDSKTNEASSGTRY